MLRVRREKSVNNKVNSSYYLILVFLIQLVVSSLLGMVISKQTVEIFFIGVNFLATFTIILRNKRDFAIILILAYILRLILSVIDVNTLVVSNFNGDTLGYYSTAVSLAHGNVPNQIYGGLYTRILSFILWSINDSRFVAEYFNIIISLCFIMVIYSTCIETGLSCSNVKKAALISAFFPYSIYNGVATYREGIIMTLLSYSFFYLVRWTKTKKTSTAIIALCLVGLACAFHAGVLPILLGYAFLMMFYSTEKKRFVFTRSTLKIIPVLLIGLYLITIRYPQFFLGKIISGFEDSENIVRHFNYSYGGSRYLTWINARSLWQVILFSPVKTFYLLFSPLPFDWRGIRDIIAFSVDSVMYIYFFIVLIKNRKIIKASHFIMIVLVSLIAVFFVFGVGTWTAGTAMRHRCKVLGIIIVLLLNIKDNKQSTIIP